ncbi:uncharacterized protein [Pocillopora verrucosa]|uniref:uncharacterized protein isoform X2 n=1 Tax=Pocillopora verrucosa TaxID=203993 RepID=UPI00334183F6
MSRLQKDSTIPSVASMSLEDQESRTLKVTLLSSEWRSSTDGDLSTINRELAIQLAKHPHVDVSILLPNCSREDRSSAESHNVKLIEAVEIPGVEPVLCLLYPPIHHTMHCVIGHGVQLGRLVPFIKRNPNYSHCKWIQVVHSVPEEDGMYKNISEGEKRQKTEIQLCKMADQVITIGPKLTETYKRYLCSVKQEEKVFDLTPSIFSEFLEVRQATEERRKFCILVIGSGDSCEDFNVKGYDIAAKAIARLKDESYQLKFVCPAGGKGDSVAKKLLRRGISRNQLIVRSFDDSRKVLADLFCEVDLAIMPSRTEGFGTTALEALSAGLPVLVSGNSGLGEALKKVPLGSQSVVDSEDPKGWAREIKRIRQKEREVRLSESRFLREKYLEKYSWEEPCKSLVIKMRNLLFGGSEQVIRSLQQWQQNASSCKISSNTDPLSDFKRKGYRISNNPGSGNCMFYALSEQLEVVKRVKIHHFELRQSLVQYLREHPKLVDGTDLFHFVDRHTTWDGYLTDMEQDGTWGDHVILWAAANCYQIAIHVISSLPGHSEVIINPDCSFDQSKLLVLGHVHEVHYVSLQPLQDAVAKKSRQVSNEKVTRSSSSVVTQSVKRPRDAVVNKSRQSSNKEVKQSSSSVATQSVKRLNDSVLKKSRQASNEKVKRRSSSVATQSEKRLKDAAVNKSRQALNEKVKRRSSSVATQSVKRRIGSDHCLIVEHLEGEYIRRSNVKPLLWDSDIQLPIDEVYTRLQMKWRKKAYFQLTEKEVHMYEVFKPAREGEKGARMVLVEGNPGIGKTTFCLKIASDWAKKLVPVEFHFPMFQLLFLLKCCDIHEDTKDIVQAIDEQLLNDDINNKEEFLDYIRDGKNQDEILLILDGLDELPKASENVVNRLFRRKVFSRCFILATSREEKGIDVRRRYDFDTLLQIKGFTSEDATDYIRKHFKSVDPQNLSKSERLIETVQTNTHLSVLRSNPLNLLLLCVVFEDFEGELPSNRTKLYQIIFRCLLRRYCSRNGLNVHRNADEALENQFKKSLLVLGELAWNCLREDRRSFSEEELDKLEHSRTRVRRFPAIKLGLVFMEASSRPSQEPRHQCHFLHKTFQEFLAAFYLANHLSRRRLNLTDHSVFRKESMLGRYRQVFFFLAGILGMERRVFFKEVVTILREDFVWCYSHRECEFFLELFQESGAADDLGKVACSLIPLPNVLKLNQKQLSWLKLIRYVYEGAILEGDVASVQLTKLSLSGVQFFSKDNVNDLHGILGSSQTLTELVIGNIENMSPGVADLFAESLSSSTSLRTATLRLFDVSTERFASNFSTLLSTLSQLECLSLEVFGVLNNTAAQAVKALFKSSLISLAFIVHGDQDDRLMSIVSEGLAEETAVESLSFVVYERVSNPGIAALQKGILQNRTLHSLELKVYGDIPGAWMAAVAIVLAAKKSWKSLVIHPNVCGKIKYEAGLLPYPILGDAPLKSLTVNVCGELSVHSLKALTDFFKESSPLSGLHLNVRSKQSNEVVDCLVDYFLANSSLPSRSIIYLSGEITGYEGTALQRLDLEHSVSVYSNGLDEDHFPSGFHTLANFSSASDTFLVDGKTATYFEVITLLSRASTTMFNLTVNLHADAREDWAKGVGNGLANSRSLTTFSLTVNSPVDVMGNWARDVGDGLAKSTSLTTFILTVKNYVDAMGNWASDVGDCLAKSTSLTTFSLTVNDYVDVMGNWTSGVGNGLAKSTSLTTFSLTVNNYVDAMGDWASGVGNGLANNRSLTSFSLTVNNHAGEKGHWMKDISEGLAENGSLTTIRVAFSLYGEDRIRQTFR